MASTMPLPSFKTWPNPARRPRWCWAATPRVPPSWTSSPQRAGRSLDSQVRCRKPSLTTSRQWRSSVTRRTVSATRCALSPLYGSKAIDLCNGADPVCSTGDDIPAQSLYVEAGMTTQAAQFVAGSSQECTDYPASSRQQLIAERAPWAQSCFAATMSTMLARHPNSKPLLARGSPVWLHRFLQSAAHAGDDDDR